MNDAASASRPRAWRLQFSLRLLLLAFTTFAIGFPIWYRWPYQETIEQRDAATGKLQVTRIITWQRQWGGDHLMHGPEQIIRDDTTMTTNYVRGKRQGPYTVRTANDRWSVMGQYLDDLKEGRWTEERRWASEAGRRTTITTWHSGLLDGDSRFIAGARGPDVTNTATFEAGRLVKYNGQSVNDATFDILRKRHIDQWIASELLKETNIDFVEMPLKDAMLYIGDLHKVPIVLDARGDFSVDLPTTVTLQGLDLQSALVLLLAPHGLACDFRYGSLWITDADKAQDWRDPTGVDQIRPPAGSALARAWDVPIVIDFLKTPLADAMKFVEQVMDVPIDARPAHNATDGRPMLVTTSLRGLPLRHAMGQMLYNCGCKCKLEGETLVILPPEAIPDESNNTRSTPATSASSLP